MMKRKKTKVRVLILVLSLFIIATSACAAQDVPREVMNSLNSVVRIFSEYVDGTSSGSGFVVFSDDYTTLIATNNHVIEGGPIKISVVINTTEKITATILAANEQKDLCILKLKHPMKLAPIALNGTLPSQGDAIYAVGFPAAADNLSMVRTLQALIVSYSILH